MSGPGSDNQPGIGKGKHGKGPSGKKQLRVLRLKQEQERWKAMGLTARVKKLRADATAKDRKTDGKREAVGNRG